MRQNLQDSRANGLEVVSKFKLTGNPTTLGGNVTVTDDFPVVLSYDAGGSSRNVTMPTRALANDNTIRLVVNLSTAGENLTLKDAAATTILTLPSGGVALVIAGGTAEAPGTRGWTAVPIGGEDLALADDLAITGDLAVTGNTTLNGNANVGNAAADTVGFYDGTGITQRASSNQASTNAAVSASFGATQLAILQEIMNTLTLLKLWKGAA